MKKFLIVSHSWEFKTCSRGRSIWTRAPAWFWASISSANYSMIQLTVTDAQVTVLISFYESEFLQTFDSHFELETFFWIFWKILTIFPRFSEFLLRSVRKLYTKFCRNRGNFEHEVLLTQRSWYKKMTIQREKLNYRNETRRSKLWTSKETSDSYGLNHTVWIIR